MRRENPNPASIILKQLQAEESFREREGEKFRFRIASNVRTLWHGRGFLIRLSVFGFVFGILSSFLLTARYTSTTRLMPPDNQSASSLAAAATSMASAYGSGFGEIATDLLGLKGSSDVFVGILSSRTVQNEIVEQFDLKHVYGVSHISEARAKLASRVDISVDRKDQIITIGVSDRSPQRAEGMAKAYVDQLNRLVSDLSTSSARRERIFLENRLVQVNQDLEAAEKEFSQFASKNSAIDINEQGKAMIGAAATLQGQLMSEKSELEGLRQIYADSSVRVRSSKARIAELQAQLEKLGGKDQANTPGSDAGPGALYPSIRKLPLLGVTYADLFRRTKVQEAVYQVLTQEYELAKVQEAREIPTVKVLDPADIPENRSFPPRRFVIGTFTMLLACFGAAVFLLGSKSWNESNPRAPGRVVMTEIWIDLKEKRFLNSGNGVHHRPEADSDSSLHHKRDIYYYLGLDKAARRAMGSRSSSEYVSAEEQEEHYESKPSRSSNGSGEENGFHGTE